MSNANQTLPAASVTELAPGAAFAPAGTEEVVVFMGPSSKGPLNSPRLFGAQDVADLVATFGTGPTVKEAAKFASKVAQPFVFVRLTTASVAATKTTATVVKDPSSTFTSTLSGTPTVGADILITFTLGGTTGTGPITYTVSTDGGITTGAPVNLGIGTTIAVLGVTVTLGSGHIITTGDTIAWFQMPSSSTVLPTTFTGTGTSVITVTGTPNDAYEVAFQATKAGTIGAGSTIKFRYTLDANAPSPTWSAEISLGSATTFDLVDGPLSTEPTGLTLNFGAGNLAALDLFTFTTSSPAYDSSGATAGLGTPTTGLLGWNGTWTWVRLVGPVTSALAGSIDSIIAGFDAYNHPAWAVVDYRDRATTETVAAHSLRFQADFANYTSTRVGVTFGYCRYQDPINGRNNRRPNMGVLTQRAQAYAINVNWAEYDFGPLPADVTITDANNVTVEHNANTDPQPNSMGAITLRNWPGQAGVFPTQACLMGPDTDIKLVPLRRVMNAAKVVQFEVEKLQILQNPPTYKAGDPRIPKGGSAGDIEEPWARSRERIGNKLIGDALNGLVSGFTFKINRTPVSLGGGNYKVLFTLKIQPVIYIVLANGTAQFVNTALDVSNTKPS